MGKEVLSLKEQQELTRHEIIIKTGMLNFFEVGFALCQIKEKMLYRETHDTFEDYCREKWDIARQTAYQFIASSEVIENVRNCGQIEPPKNEAQARHLAKLPSKEQAPAWQMAVETAPDGKITARHVKKTVKEIIGDPVGDGLKKTHKRIINKEDIIEDSFREIFRRFIGAIQNAREAKWKTTSREAVIKLLESLLAILEGESSNV